MKNKDKMTERVKELAAAGIMPAKSVDYVANMPTSGTFSFTGEVEPKTYTIDGKTSWNWVYKAVDDSDATRKILISKSYLFGNQYVKEEGTVDIGTLLPRTTPFIAPMDVVEGYSVADLEGKKITFKNLGTVFVAKANSYQDHKLSMTVKKENYSGAEVL